MQQEAETDGLGHLRRGRDSPAASAFVFEQFLCRFRDQRRAVARSAFEKEQTLTEDEAVEQECLRIGFFSRAASTPATAAAAASSDRAHCRIAMPA
jgi:hypothetical protein